MWTNARRYDIQRWELIAGDTKYRDGNRRQAIAYTEMGIDGRRYDIQRWELMVDDTIFREGTDCRRYDIRDGN